MKKMLLILSFQAIFGLQLWSQQSENSNSTEMDEVYLLLLKANHGLSWLDSTGLNVLNKMIENPFKYRNAIDSAIIFFVNEENGEMLSRTTRLILKIETDYNYNPYLSEMLWKLESVIKRDTFVEISSLKTKNFNTIRFAQKNILNKMLGVEYSDERTTNFCVKMLAEDGNQTIYWLCVQFLSECCSSNKQLVEEIQKNLLVKKFHNNESLKRFFYDSFN